MREVFASPPRYNLQEFMGVQMLINNIDENEITRRVPHIVSICMKHFENLIESQHMSRKRILCSFYDLNNKSIFEDNWGEQEERRLRNMKDIINDNRFIVSKQTDTRILAMAIIDFLESLTEPAISEHTVENLSIQIKKGVTSTEIITDALNHQLVVPRQASNVGILRLIIESEQI
jgi:hypothetical protein